MFFYAIVTLFLSLSLPFLLIPLFRSLSIYDIPNERSSHKVIAIRGLGLSTLISFTVGVLLFLFWGSFSRSEGYELLAILFGTVSISLVGFIEDFKGISVTKRLLSQLILGGCVIALISSIIGAQWVFWGLLGAVFVAGFTNISNFMDGIDGISTIFASVIGVFFAFLGTNYNFVILTVIGMVLISSFVGFMPWNFFGRGFFLGDVGSYLIGASISIASLYAVIIGFPIWLIISPLLFYLLDTVITLCVRISKKEKWLSAHRSHIYQKLVDSGQKHIPVALYVAGFSALSGALAIFVYEGLMQLPILVASQVLLGSIYLLSPLILRSINRKS